MKRCYVKSAVFLVLVLTSLLVFTTCGIPTYLNLDGDYTWNIDNTSVADTIDVSFTLTSNGLLEIQSKVDPSYGLGIKLFYALSNSSNQKPFIVQNLSVEESFRNFIKRKSTGNGRPWTVESNGRAPGFYLFKAASTSIDPASIERPSDTLIEEDGSRVVLGTFAFSDSPTSSNRTFRTSPAMDLPLDWNTGSVAFKLTLQANDLLLESGTVGSLTATDYLWDYKKQGFPRAINLTDYITTNLRNDPLDGSFWEYLNTGEDLYLHLYATLHGGTGFTNTYWSELKYLGKFELSD